MFHYTLPCGGFKTFTKITETGISFDPPVYEQRYCMAIQILEDTRWVNEIKKVTEFGCADMKLFQLMRRIETIENILQVDIDGENLRLHVSRTNPLICDFLSQRESPLRVEVLHGNVADSSDELRNTDAVIALELIEHVYDDVLSKIPANIFGFMQPKIAVFSTPNSDYNRIFTRFNPLLPNGFRHHDHKFEWTREQFKSWCLGITERYPNYKFSLLGVGEPPPDDDSVGFVTQVALFVRKDMLGLPLEAPLTIEALDNGGVYKSLHLVDYPFHKDTRTPEQKIWMQIVTQLFHCTLDEDNFDYDRRLYKMSIDELTRRVEYLDGTRETVLRLLEEHGKPIEDGFVLVEDEEGEEEPEESCENDDPPELSEGETKEEEDWDS